MASAVSKRQVAVSAWIAFACVVATIALDRVVILLVDAYGAQVAVPGGPYRGDDLTGRHGDEVDIALAALAVVLAGWALWSNRTATGCTGYLVTSGVIAVVCSAVLIGAYFFTPLYFSLSPGVAGDDLTLGQVPGPYWYQIARPLLLGVAVLAVIATAIKAANPGPTPRPATVSGTGPAPVATRPPGARLALWGALGSIGAAVLMLAFNLMVAVIAGTAPTDPLLPLAALVPITVATVMSATRTRPGNLLAVGTGVLAPLWLGLAVWLVFTNPLTIEPSPVDDATRDSVEPWAAPALLVSVALMLAAQVLSLVAVSRRG